MSARLNRIVQVHDVSASIEMLDAFRYGKINQPFTPWDRKFGSKTARRRVRSPRPPPVYGLVDFSGLARDLSARLNRIVQKHGFSASIEMLDAFRYGKINQPFTRWDRKFGSETARRTVRSPRPPPVYRWEREFVPFAFFSGPRPSLPYAGPPGLTTLRYRPASRGKVFPFAAQRHQCSSCFPIQSPSPLGYPCPFVFIRGSCLLNLGLRRRLQPASQRLASFCPNYFCLSVFFLPCRSL